MLRHIKAARNKTTFNFRRSLYITLPKNFKKCFTHSIVQDVPLYFATSATFTSTDKQKMVSTKVLGF